MPTPIPPAPDQESVWDYPRPPALEPVPELLRIEVAGRTLAETLQGYRVLETSHPPVYYFPWEAVDHELIVQASGTSVCEWKGVAHYVDVVVGGRRLERAGWFYPEPAARFAALKNAIAFYAGPMDACWVGQERAQPQPGGFYGGWITAKVVGPFKGPPGSWGW